MNPGTAWSVTGRLFLVTPYHVIKTSYLITPTLIAVYAVEGTKDISK